MGPHPRTCAHAAIISTCTPRTPPLHAHSQDFDWSPSDPVLAAYTAEQNQMPARIVLVKIPERTEIRQKNLFSVSDVRIFWHPQVRSHEFV